MLGNRAVEPPPRLVVLWKTSFLGDPTWCGSDDDGDVAVRDGREVVWWELG